MQEKNKTITQVKKIGRRYKSQYEELKAQYDKVGWQQIPSGSLGMQHIYWIDKVETLRLFKSIRYGHFADEKSD